MAGNEERKRIMYALMPTKATGRISGLHQGLQQPQSVLLQRFLTIACPRFKVVFTPSFLQESHLLGDLTTEE
jgi:hypothetical protein